MTNFTYGCNNGKRPAAGAPLIVQDGYHEGFSMAHFVVDRRPRWITIPFAMSTECHFDKSATDPGCNGCAHAPHLRAVE